MIAALQYIRAWLQLRFAARDAEPECSAEWFDTGQGEFYGHCGYCPIHGLSISEADLNLDKERRASTRPRSIP